jgi:hypothetical protein
MTYLLSAIIFLIANGAFASTSQLFVCDMRELTVNDTNTGLIKLKVFKDHVIVGAGIFGNDEVAILLPSESRRSKSSTLFLNKDENGNIHQSFDLFPSGKNGVFIWRNYDWKNPNERIRTTIHICNEVIAP